LVDAVLCLIQGANGKTAVDMAVEAYKDPELSAPPIVADELGVIKPEHIDKKNHLNQIVNSLTAWQDRLNRAAKGQ
jgi:hypothetical protein